MTAWSVDYDIPSSYSNQQLTPIEPHFSLNSLLQRWYGSGNGGEVPPAETRRHKRQNPITKGEEYDDSSNHKPAGSQADSGI